MARVPKVLRKKQPDEGTEIESSGVDDTGLDEREI